MEKKSYQHPEETPGQVQEPAAAYQRISETEISVSELTQVQLKLLQMFSYIKTEEALQNLKKLLREFYIQQIQKEADQYWTEGKISDELLNEHLRTPYK